NNLIIGSGLQQISVAASKLDITAGRDVTLFTTVDALDLRAFQGNGAALTVVAGTGGQGNILVHGSLFLNGENNGPTGSGNGGTVSLTTKSTDSFFIGSASDPVNGVKGSITVTGAATGGSGGI